MKPRMYYTGGRVTYGTDSVAASREPSDSSLYHSPIDYNCQKNFIVYLTDGEPTRDDAADSAIMNLADFPDPDADPPRASRTIEDIIEARPATPRPTRRASTRRAASASTISPSSSPKAINRRSTG